MTTRIPVKTMFLSVQRDDPLQWNKTLCVQTLPCILNTLFIPCIIHPPITTKLHIVSSILYSIHPSIHLRSSPVHPSIQFSIDPSATGCLYFLMFLLCITSTVDAERCLFRLTKVIRYNRKNNHSIKHTRAHTHLHIHTHALAANERGTMWEMTVIPNQGEMIAVFLWTLQSVFTAHKNILTALA